MAKINFNKLNLKIKESEEETLKYPIDDSFVEIKVKKHIPLAEKEKLVNYVINNSIDISNNTFSPLRLRTYFELGTVIYYTNLSFTEKQLEKIYELYDKLNSNGLIRKIYELVDKEESLFMWGLVKSTAEDYSKYLNSFAGMIQAVSSNAHDMNDEIDNIMKQIENKEGFEELSNIIKNMG